MDAPIISENSFSEANPSAYSLTEIWPSPVNGNGGVGNQSGGGLGVRMSSQGGSNHDVSVDESTITEHSGSRGGGVGRKRSDAYSEVESSKVVSTSSRNDLNNSNDKRMKISGSREENGGLKSEMQANSEPGIKPAEQSTRPSEPPKQDYIHVRARRGQATDSHSLAERARREKISERMKILQDLVPGCKKVVGKALVLDEIINYIQSLQHQAKFLSMKLEAVNSSMNSPIERFFSKDLGVPTSDASEMINGIQAMGEYIKGSEPEWLHMQVSTSFDIAT